MNWHAFFYKQLLMNISQPAELLWIFFYPFVGLVSLGMMSLYLKSQGAGSGFVYFVLVGTICWDFLNLSQKSITYSLLYDIWANCLRYTFMAPIKMRDFVFGHGLFGFASALAGFSLTQIVAYFVFDFNVFRAGWLLLPCAVIIWMFAVSLGLVINAFVLRKGYEVSFLAWTTVGITMVFSGVYYPITVFPASIQIVSKLIPITHVIIALRGILLENVLRLENVGMGLMLSTVYLIGAYLFFKASVKRSKENVKLSNW